jgi:hypothetical protein
LFDGGAVFVVVVDKAAGYFEQFFIVVSEGAGSVREVSNTSLIKLQGNNSAKEKKTLTPLSSLNPLLQNPRIEIEFVGLGVDDMRLVSVG